MNFEKIYEEGFYVCYDLYGLRWDNDEFCVFCLEVIYCESGWWLIIRGDWSGERLF